MTVPCEDCKYKRFGKDTSQSFRNCLGFYVCIRDPVIALVMDDSALMTIEQLGCKHKKTKTPSQKTYKTKMMELYSSGELTI